jgi:glucose-6-phosphate isomerase
MDTLRVDTRNVAPQPRTLREMQSVIFDKEWLRGANVDQSLYFMYRDCVLPEDQQIARQLEIRYDITVLLPVCLGKEFNKTKGHYHSEYKPGLCYPELYQVLEGQAHILLQKPSAGTVSEAMVIVAHEGQIVLVPPNYGHITINPTEKTLKMANWVSTRVHSFYEPFEEKGGGAYRELCDGQFIPNPRYGALPPLRVVSAHEYPELGLRHGQPIYELIRIPERLRFLSYPDELQEH